MYKFAFCFALVLGITLSIPFDAPQAAQMDDVLGACDRTPGCGYSKSKNGDVSGCVVKNNAGPGSCFYCNNDTKECIAVRRLPTGKLHPLGSNVMGMFADRAMRSGDPVVRLPRAQVPAR